MPSPCGEELPPQELPSHLRTQCEELPSHNGEGLPSPCGEELPSHCGEGLPLPCGEELPPQCVEGLPSHLRTRWDLTVSNLRTACHPMMGPRPPFHPLSVSLGTWSGGRIHG